MSTRTEVCRRKLLQSLEGSNPYPIDLEWMVEIFKYKHISSLTTHLKRHCRERKEYLKRAEGTNKKSTRYFISVECFKRICYFCRHSERKAVAKYWLRKLAMRDKQLYDNLGRNVGKGRVGYMRNVNAKDMVDLPQEGTTKDGSECSGEDTSGSDTNAETSDYSGSYSEQDDEDYSSPHSLIDDTDLQHDRVNSPLVNNTHYHPNTGVLPQVLHPFNFFFHDWSYLKLCPINHYLISFYYSLPNHYSLTHDKNMMSNSDNSRLQSNPPVTRGENGTTTNILGKSDDRIDVDCNGNDLDADPSFDTNAFLSIPDEQQLPTSSSNHNNCTSHGTTTYCES
jgi:hypothetical protein